MIKVLRRNAGSRRPFRSGYKKGCVMKKTMPYCMLVAKRQIFLFVS
jgi:hypothetical protein